METGGPSHTTMVRKVARFGFAAAAAVAPSLAGVAAQTSSYASLAREIPVLMERGNIPGLSIAVIREGAVAWAGAFGTLGNEIETPVNDETIFAAASLSKPVFAYALMRLVERGEFDLDAPLFTYLEYPRLAHDSRYRELTARLVLSHTTGLPNWGGETLEFLRDPGAQFGYSGEGFVFLQRAVEAHTGLSLEELARREVFEPLGMTRTSYEWRLVFEGNTVTGLDWAGREQSMPHHSEGNAAYSLLTTARDYGKLVLALLEPRGLAPATVDEVLGVQSDVKGSKRGDSGGRVFWGLGWGLQRGSRGNAFWHWGDSGGFKAYVIAYPERREGLVYFTNANDGISIADAMLAQVFPDDHWALRWMGYERHDDPKRVARKSVERAFLQDGVEAGSRRYRQLRQRSPKQLDANTLRIVGAVAHARERYDIAVGALALNAEEYPDSASAHRDLGETWLAMGRYERAIESYSRAFALASEEEEGGDEARVQWIRERLGVERHPVSLSPEQLQRVVGDFGPRHVRWEDGALFYRRDGNTEYRLIPMAEDLFALDGVETFRMRFVFGATGQAVKIVALYFDGSHVDHRR